MDNGIPVQMLCKKERGRKKLNFVYVREDGSVFGNGCDDADRSERCLRCNEQAASELIRRIQNNS